MSFLKKFLGKDKGAPEPAKPPAPAPATSPNDQDLIRVVDGFGRELQITRQDWREKVLLGSLRNVWDKPKELYGMIVSALNDGFRPDIIDATKHLYEMEPGEQAVANLWGVVLTEEERLDEAEKVFRDFVNQKGEASEAGLILCNLAKVYAKRGDEAHTAELLWHGLELDPNQENGMGWYVARERERGGESAAHAAFQQMAALPGSWRPQIWLAREALAARDLPRAMELYGESLARAGDPTPTDALMQISGDLGKQGHLVELLNLTATLFKIEIHGLQVGNNLIKANLDLGQLDEAKRIVDQLYLQKRPDWQPTLGFWDTEIAKARITTRPHATAESIEMAMLAVEGPVWLKQDSRAAELFPATPKEGVLVCFLGGSAERASNSKRIETQMADTAGRLSRALPLFLAEHVGFGARAQTRTLVPWVVKPSGGFVLAGTPWSDEDAANYARRDEPKADYVVITHLKTQKEPWTVELRLVRTIDGKCLGVLSSAFMPGSPQGAFPNLAGRLLTLLADEAEVHLQAPAVVYEAPSGEQFPFYLLRLEQLLAVRCAAMDGIGHEFLNGEREIIAGTLQLSVAFPKNVNVRVLLAQIMLTMKRIRPELVASFRDSIALLQKQHPLPEPAQGVVQRLFDEALSESPRPPGGS